MPQTKIEDHFSPRRSRRQQSKRTVVHVHSDSDDAIDRVKVDGKPSQARPRTPYIEVPSLSVKARKLYSPLAPGSSAQSAVVIASPPPVAATSPPRQSAVTPRRKQTSSSPSSPSSSKRSPTPPTVPATKRMKTTKCIIVESDRESDTPVPIKPPRKTPSRRAPVPDPDESEEDMVADIELDEADRFETSTRLRKKKETPFQRSVRKAREMRLGIIADDTSSSESSSSGSSSRSSRSSDFIDEDGGLEDGVLPHEFSRNATQSPEYKFKVVFHYLLLLVMRGPKLLPLKGETREYFDPMLQDLRRRMRGLREQRVRSQIWRTEFVRALETLPDFRTTLLEYATPGCDACNISTRMSSFQVHLEGEPYNKDTHEPDSDEDDEGEVYTMGKYCHRRAQAFHALCHWENELHDKIRGYYHDLLRAMKKPVPDDSEASDSDDDRRARTAARIQRLQKTKLPSKVDIDKVLVWMDARGYQKREWQWLEGVEEQARLVEHDNARDE